MKMQPSGHRPFHIARRARASVLALAVAGSLLSFTGSITRAAGLDLPFPPAQHGGVYVVAHRGAHDGIPENTLPAYERAIELGCDFVEIDIRTTKDGHFVSIHNATIDAYTMDGTTGAVHDMTLAELKAVDIGSRVGPEWADTRIPTLEEILALCRGRVGIYLDLKDGDVEQIAAIVRAYGMTDYTLWYGVGRRIVERVNAACPECIPMPDPGPERNLPALLEHTRPKVVAAVWRHFSPSFVQACHAAGAIVIVDEQDPSSWEDAVEWGANGIQTDYPEALIAFLRDRDTGGSGLARNDH